MFNFLSNFGLIFIGAILLLISYDTARTATEGIEPIAWFAAVSMVTGFTSVLMFYTIAFRDASKVDDSPESDEEKDKED